MILQLDSRLNKEIRDSNGLGMCIYWYFNKLLKREITIEMINSFIPSLDDLKKDFNVGYKKPYYMCKLGKEYEILELQTKNGNKFVCGDGFSHVTYDPKGVSEEFLSYIKGEIMVINKIVISKKE